MGRHFSRAPRKGIPHFTIASALPSALITQDNTASEFSKWARCKWKVTSTSLIVVFFNYTKPKQSLRKGHGFTFKQPFLEFFLFLWRKIKTVHIQVKWLLNLLGAWIYPTTNQYHRSNWSGRWISGRGSPFSRTLFNYRTTFQLSSLVKHQLD